MASSQTKILSFAKIVTYLTTIIFLVFLAFDLRYYRRFHSETGPFPLASEISNAIEADELPQTEQGRQKQKTKSWFFADHGSFLSPVYFTYLIRFVSLSYLAAPQVFCQKARSPPLV